MVTHNVLVAHAAAVQRFRKVLPRGNISINLNAEWSEPMSSSPADKVHAATIHFLEVSSRCCLLMPVTRGRTHL